MNLTNIAFFNSNRRLPVILQTELAECGVASMVMIANYYGSKIDLNTVRQKFSISSKGVSLNGLMLLADKLQFSSRPLRLEIEDISKLKTPTILHWDLTHFVVLKQIKNNVIIVHDPAQGKTKYTLKEFSNHFTGIALELTPAPNFKPIKKVRKAKLSDFWGSISGLKRGLIQILLLSLLLQVFSIAAPFYMQIIVDDVIISNDLDLLIILALGFGLMKLISSLVTVLREAAIIYMGAQLNLQIATNLFRHLLKLPLEYFEKRHIGGIQSRFGSLETIKKLLTTGLVESIVDGMMAIGLLSMMIIYSFKLTLIVIISGLIYLIFRVLSYQSFHQLNEESIVKSAKQNSNFIETIRAMQSIKLFGNETQRQSVWQNLYVDTINANIKVQKTSMKYNFVDDLLFGIENIIVIYLAAIQVTNNLLSMGMLFAFVSYKSQFTTRYSALINKFIQYKMLSLHMERLGDIILSEQEKNLYGTDLRAPISGYISLKGIDFRYSDNDSYILKNLNIKIKKGSSIAIIGPSGSGKTTLMKVMLGLLQPKCGAVYLDNRKDIRQYGLRHYRQQIGTVMQDDQLLSGSICDNICFFEPDFNMDRIIECSILSSIHNDIMKMPMNYNTFIGDMGNNLSGGQIQRILLARALYKKPKILFLDEATSSLDVTLEKRINRTIMKLNITRIIIAHRPETIAMADSVFVLKNKKLIASKNYKQI